MGSLIGVMLVNLYTESLEAKRFTNITPKMVTGLYYLDNITPIRLNLDNLKNTLNIVELSI